MSLQPKLLVSVGALLSALVGVFAFLFLRTADRGAHPTEARLGERMERASVRFHRAVRARVVRDGDRFAARLERAADDPVEAGNLAELLLSDLEHDVSHAPEEPMLHHFGSPELTPAMDRLHLTLAMLWSERHPERSKRIPTYAFLYEARALEEDRLEGPYVELAQAAQAFAHASGGYCDLVEGPTLESPTDSGPLHFGGETATRRLRLLQSFLVDGSLACCAMRSDRLEETTGRLEQSIVDAEALGISGARMGLLRAWTAVLKGEKERARAALDGLTDDALHEDDREAHRIIRTALATDGEDAAARAHRGTTRVEWLSRLVVAGALEAVQGSELEEPLRTSEAARAAQRLVRGEAAVIDAARRIDPFFPQGPRGPARPVPPMR